MGTSEQRRLVFLADYPFSDRDFERFGIATLRNYFDVEIYDVANIVNPKSLAIRALPRTTDSGLRTFATIQDVVDGLLDNRPHVVVSNIGLTKTRQTIYQTLKSIGTETCDLRVCLTPGDSITTDPSWKRITNRIKQTTGLISLLKLIGRKYLSPQIEHIPADVLVAGGRKSTEATSPDTKILKAHSLDFDRHLSYRNEKPAPAFDRPYAVYLDQVMGFHVDYEFSGLRVPIEPSSFYQDLYAYFQRFMKSTGLMIAACPHPRSNAAFVKTRLRGIEVTDIPAVEAIANAACVLGHNSTALSFAVLWNKPAILLANDDLMDSWEGPFVAKFSKHLNARIDMIDDRIGTASPRIEPVSDLHYETYVRDFLSEVPEDHRSTWSIVGEYLTTRLSS